jgi:ankyrin repeat protein
MTRVSSVAVVAACVLTLSSCDGRRAQNGGEPERQLAAATAAGDAARVSQLLASGADPNKVVRVDGDKQSPWFLALRQVRARRPELVDIVKSMLKAGANPNETWGTAVGTVGPKQSAWQRFFSEGGGRQSGFGSDTPIHVATFPGAEVVRALVAAGFNPRDGNAALVSAVEAEDSEIVHTLVEAGVDVNCRPGANTPLVAAIEARNVALMHYLEEHGAREKP